MATCIGPNCDRRTKSSRSDVCEAHCQQRRRNIWQPLRTRRGTWTGKRCGGPQCDHPAKEHGLCQGHRLQQRKGRPLQPLRKSAPHGSNVGKTCEAPLCRGARCSSERQLCNSHVKSAPDAGALRDLFEVQGGACAICRAPFTPCRMYRVDHDHRCCPPAQRKLCGNCTRGLLCGPCNLGMGNFQDNPEMLHRAATYLEKAQRFQAAE